MKEMPYTVPEGFFDEVRTNALEGAAMIRTRRRTVFGGVGIAAALLAVALVFNPFGRTYDYDYAEAYYNQDLIESYDCDIFLDNFNL